ncbi:hypothetical protein I2494_17210 [Budviciaceae bacterium BWR-B9]|uniref:Lipoprotein n=1 Tax=Limnobaculum allomyrinae TaxID=2791986 RepID=A0ABS1IUS1_9GAMM|nr:MULTISPECIES: hypothetical protein [Limnobaculum]MBK5145429.1 hypothetical protein [Limnobaculum allomyrinae]MBV7693143.1 hypothetical protein [Limnobaculum sp. M2-1]
MGKVLIVSLLSLFVLAGCNSAPEVGNWSKAGASAQTADADRVQCEKESRSSANNSYHSDPLNETGSDETVNKILVKEQQQVDLVGECMREKGYTNF